MRSYKFPEDCIGLKIRSLPSVVGAAERVVCASADRLEPSSLAECLCLELYLGFLSLTLFSGSCWFLMP